MRHGMYWSGDLAYRDADGWVYLAGRTADWMRVDGENLAAAPIERILERLQQVGQVAVYAVPDERVQPLVRQVSRIHVIEEARHIRYAREELKRQVASSSATRRKLTAARLAWGMSGIINRNLVHPSGYAAVGLDPRAAREAAHRSPHRRATKQWAARKSMAAFAEAGLLDGRARAIWQKAGFLAPDAA